jgi:DNA-binding transcriptional LysR family regulator
MEFDNVEAIKSVVEVGLGASIVPSMCLGGGHVRSDHTKVVRLTPSVSRQMGLVRVREKRETEGMKLVAAALLTLRKSA